MTQNADIARSPELTVFFDGSCPLCIREIGFYRRRRGADAIAWIDVSAEPAGEAGALLAAPGLSRCDAMARFHVMDADGALVSGGEAFARLWAALPAFRPLGAIALTPPFRWLLNRAYDIFLTVRPALQSMARRTPASPQQGS